MVALNKYLKCTESALHEIQVHIYMYTQDLQEWYVGHICVCVVINTKTSGKTLRTLIMKERVVENGKTCTMQKTNKSCSVNHSVLNFGCRV